VQEATEPRDGPKFSTVTDNKGNFRAKLNCGIR
jgi:hypothetical protein